MGTILLIRFAGGVLGGSSCGRSESSWIAFSKLSLLGFLVVVFDFFTILLDLELVLAGNTPEAILEELLVCLSSNMAILVNGLQSLQASVAEKSLTIWQW